MHVRNVISPISFLKISWVTAALDFVTWVMLISDSHGLAAPDLVTLMLLGADSI